MKQNCKDFKKFLITFYFHPICHEYANMSYYSHFSGEQVSISQILANGIGKLISSTLMSNAYDCKGTSQLRFFPAPLPEIRTIHLKLNTRSYIVF